MAIPGSVKATKNIMRWASQGRWGERYAAWLDDFTFVAAEAMDVDPEILEEEMHPDHYEYFIAFASEDFVSSYKDEDDGTIIDDYLKRRGWKESPGGKRFLAAMRDSTASVYEIVDIERGRQIVLRDLLRPGELVVIEERGASEVAALWDRIVARVLRIGGKNYLTSVILQLRFDQADALSEAFQTAETDGNDNGPVMDVAERLRRSGPLFATQWLVCLDDEDALFIDDDVGDGKPTTVMLPIVGDEGAVIAALDALPDFTRQGAEGTGWVWRPAFAPSAAGSDKRIPANDTEEALGIVAVGDSHVIVMLFDDENLARSRAMLTETLGDLVKDAPVFLDMPSGIFDSAENMEQFESLTHGQPDNATSVEEIEADFHKAIAKRLDEKAEELGGMTPREAAATPSGRKDVANWLKMLENVDWHLAAEVGEAPFDLRWAWEELGVADLRQ